MPKIETTKTLITATHGCEHSELIGPQKQLKDAGATAHVATPDGEAIKGWDTVTCSPETSGVHC